MTGHQDKKTAFEYLPIPAQLNVLADKAADNQYSHPIQEHTIDMPHLPSQIISLSNPHGRIVANMNEELIRYHRDPTTEALISDHWNIPPNHLHLIDWEAIRKTFQAQHRFSGAFTKIIHNQWDTTSRKRSWGLTTDGNCPLCHKSEETAEHVLQCPHFTLSQVRKKAQTDLWKSLNSARTNPDIITTIKNISQAWHQKSLPSIPPRSNSKVTNSIRKAVKHQQKIGFSNFFKGILSIKWNKSQKKYCKKHKQRFNPAWSKKLSTALLTYAHTLWKTRCSIIQAEKIGTADAHFRDLAYSLFLQHHKHPHHLVFRHRHLLRKSPDFFHHSHINAVQMWYKKMITSLAYCQEKGANLGRDIRTWTVLRPRDPGRRLRGARVPNRRRLYRFRSI